MAIGTAAAIGLGVGAIGSALGSSSANKQSKKAANIAAQTAQENNALAREMYGKNEANLSPFMNTGTAAMGNINALLGIAPQAQPVAQAAAPAAAYSPASGGVGIREMINRLNGGAAPTATAMPTAGTVPAVTQPTAEQAFDTYRNSTGYQFRLGEGMNALNSGYAGAGSIKSGAAMKASQEYGQNFASGEFGNYLNALGNQQALGMSGASALAGVGQNFTNTISANNNSAGTAAANAALSKQNPLANTLGMVGGGLFGMGR